MPDKDLTNLPILDDIIMPGDADKAVHNNSSKVQSSLWGNDDSETADSPLTDVQDVMDSATPEDIQVVELPAEDQLNIDAVDTVDVSPSAGISARILSDIPASSKAPEETPDEHPATITTVQDIEALTEEIMGNVMPDLEQQIRKIIRQTLQQHLPGEIDTD